MEVCMSQHADFAPPPNISYCNAVFDKFLCWPPTLAGDYASQNCPAVPFTDNTRIVRKKCSEYGFWEGKTVNDTSSEFGWTNYNTCYSTETLRLMNNLRGDEGKMKLVIAENTRILEIVGLSISLIALVISLIIFFNYRSLHNTRTRIHKNLFIAMVVQVMIRLIVYIDQAIWRGEGGDNELRGIDNTYLCEASYVLMEFGKTVMFMWMFIEGLYLNNMVTISVFQERYSFKMYVAVGWGFPILLTITWVVTNTLYFQGYASKCWWGYNLTYSYWILEGPRICVMLINFVFLMNIIRVLVLKLRQSHTSEIDKVRKAVRAAVVLLPLLGIANILTIANPLEKSVLEFAIWSYTTHFLSSFQGFFVALIYCFLNGEVRLAIRKQITLYLDMREQRDRHRRQQLETRWWRSDNANPATISSEATQIPTFNPEITLPEIHIDGLEMDTQGHNQDNSINHVTEV